MEVSFFKILLLFLCLRNVYTSNQNDPEDKFELIENLINDKFTALDGALEQIWGKLLKLEDDIDTVGARSSQDAGELKVSVNKLILMSNDTTKQVTQIKQDAGELKVSVNKLILMGNDTTKQVTQIKQQLIKIDSIEEVVEEIKGQGLEGIRNQLEEIKSTDTEIIEQKKNADNELLEKITSLLAPIEEMKTQNSNIHQKMKSIQNENTQLVFNSITRNVFIGQQVGISCGIIGQYKTCIWEHDGIMYEVSDIVNGSHEGMSRASVNHNNQCGITIGAITRSYEGLWTCRVHTHQQILEASVTIAIENTELLFNETGVSIHEGETAQLSCGVVGEYEDCHWLHNGIIYEINDIKNGSYIDIAMSPDVHQDQCGIVLPAIKKTQEGLWTCSIKAFGHSLSNSRTINIEKTLFTFDPTELNLSDAQIAHIDCGIIGPFCSCFWDHDGDTYQYSDIKRGIYPNLQAASEARNQCALRISPDRHLQHGTWTCTIIAFEKTFTASKKLSVPCGEDFNTVGEECFLVERGVSLNWDQARNHCKSKGGDLAAPRDITALHSYLKQNGWADDYYWLGISDAECEGAWRWVDGSLLTTAGWASGQPDGGAGQNCARIDTDGLLYDRPCSQQYKVICEQ